MIARNLNYLDEKEFVKINEQCLSTSKQLSGFISYLKKYEEKK
jgi:hypothetical protein